MGDNLRCNDNINVSFCPIVNALRSQLNRMQFQLQNLPSEESLLCEIKDVLELAEGGVADG